MNTPQSLRSQRANTQETLSPISSSSLGYSKEKALLLPRNVVNAVEFVGDVIEASSDVHSPIKDKSESKKKERESILKSANLVPELLNQGKLGNNPFDDSESSDDEIQDASLSLSKQISIYSKLPPPNVQSLPFNFLSGTTEDSVISNVQTNDDFESLKIRVNDYVDNLINLVDDLFAKNPNEFISYSASKKQDHVKGQPTTIQYLKAIEKANDIIEEVERSRRETLMRTKLNKTHYGE
ncbi:hypothetical protein C9374_000509 [Naegleria lovaniensis]|uniref:Uncharacterized protein n=1 Tax=Naegleria lovaniensis TaxID=51637 RepID=A0AA88KLX1_NAELO|nr:uncharacterized protein C9374_000509 [Naegleria lovaniensis]KAG2388345.1 hypothetical protein C9374_000509 [Naegleria lovaniensis]